MQRTTSLFALLATFGLAACGSGSSSESNPAPPPTTTPTEPAHAVRAPAPAPAAQPEAAQPAAAQPEAAPAPAPTPAPVPLPPGRDYIDLALQYSRVGACAGEAPIPDKLREKYVAQHCQGMKRIIDKWNKRWASKAEPFFAALVPADAPKTIVYPFAGADLITALVVFPDFTELTTLSLEPVGDPRGIGELKRVKFEETMNRIRTQFSHLVAVNHSRTMDMIEFMRAGRLPAHLIFTLTALQVRGYAPTSLRYFRIEPDGSLHYLTDEDVAALDVRKMRKRNEFFGNAEIRFAKASGPDASEKVYRHIQGNLANGHLKKDNRLLLHLQSKGKVTAMTKAASFLLSAREFSLIRDYLLDHMEWMVSDATGIPPKYAKPKGFELVTWGRFTGPLFDIGGRSKPLIKLWKDNPYQKLSFRFGYPDHVRNNHLMVARKPTN